MLLNLTNHPSATWPQDEYTAAVRCWGDIQNFPFPNVPPDWDSNAVAAEANRITAAVLALSPDAVLCQGELTLCHALVRRLQAAGIPVFSSTSERITEVKLNPDGTSVKNSVFRFVRFRAYPD